MYTCGRTYMHAYIHEASLNVRLERVGCQKKSPPRGSRSTRGGGRLREVRAVWACRSSFYRFVVVLVLLIVSTMIILMLVIFLIMNVIVIRILENTSFSFGLVLSVLRILLVLLLLLLFVFLIVPVIVPLLLLLLSSSSYPPSFSSSSSSSSSCSYVCSRKALTYICWVNYWSV